MGGAERLGLNWWSHPVLMQRYLSSLLRAEMAALRPGGWTLPGGQWDQTLHWERDLGADSLEVMSLGAVVGAAVDLPDADAAAALYGDLTLGGWQAVAESAMQKRGDRMRYRSSGSTGAPRWHSHRISDLIQEVRAMATVLGPVQRIVSAVPVHHIYGHLFAIMLPATLGRPDMPWLNLHGQGPVALSEQLSPGDLVLGFPNWWRLVEQQEVRWPEGVTGITSTAPCPDDLAQSLVARGLPRLIQIYGSSETAGVAWRDAPTLAFNVHPFWRMGRDGAGLPDPDTLIRRHALGDESSMLAPDRLAWSGHNRFAPVGRRDGVVQVGGVNVQPGAVRDRLRAHPEVEDAAVRLHDFAGQMRLKAFVVPRAHAEPEGLGERVRQWAARHLSVAARPVHVQVGSELPFNAEGKACDWRID